MGSFLAVLCETCGAERAHLRIAVQDGARPVLIIDHARERNQHRGIAGGADRIVQLALFDPVSAPFARVGLRPRDSGSICGETVLADGRHIESNGPREWLMRRSVSGLCIEMELTLEGAGDCFMNDRISRASAFLDLFEALLDGREPLCDRSEDECANVPPFNPPLVGSAPPMVELRRLVRLVAPSDLSVLVEGESGTGKEVVARNIHRLGRRSAKPFVAVSCAELPGALLQSELFGHAEGAFTGATRERAGLVESAAGGTFFLDEIGEMPLALQAALLRVLQEKEVRRLGESRRRAVDVRFVFATNRDLEDLARRGRFRKDLYYRISGMRLAVPPLRERRGDVLPLASHFLALAAQQNGCRAPSVSLEAARRLVGYRWPGNVRELRNEMERLSALHGGTPLVAASMLSPHVAPCRDAASERADADDGTLSAAVGKLERRMLAAALARWGGNRTKAAESLGITRQGLLKKLKRHARLEG